MPSGLPNEEKARVRQLYAQGKVGTDALMDAETKSYHSPGTCTFYGTANSNQMLMEMMGLHLPGAAFVNPNTPLRDALTAAAARRAIAISAQGTEYTPIGHVVDERAIVERHRRAARDRRLDQSHDPPRRDGVRRRHPDRLGRLQRALGGRAAARPHLSERQGRREPVPRGRRHGLRHRRAARRGARASPT